MDIYTDELDPYNLVIIYRIGQTYHLTGQSKKSVSTCGQVEIKENKVVLFFFQTQQRFLYKKHFNNICMLIC